jgi:hypothetical protein
MVGMFAVMAGAVFFILVARRLASGQPGRRRRTSGDAGSSWSWDGGATSDSGTSDHSSGHHHSSSHDHGSSSSDGGWSWGGSDSGSSWGGSDSGSSWGGSDSGSSSW